MSLDDPGVGNWFNVYRVLHQPEEQLASAARAAAVESKGELIQVVIEVFVADCPLMGSDEPALSAHVVLGGALTLHDAQGRAIELKRMLADRFHIEHATLEVECHACVDDELHANPHA